MKRPEQCHGSPGSFWSRLAALIGLTLYCVWFYSLTLPNARLSDGTPITRPDIWINLPEILLQNLVASDTPEEAASGWAFLPQRADLVGIALFIIVAAAAAGQMLLRLLGLRSTLEHPERAVLSCGLGLSALSLLTLALGSAGLLKKWLFVLLLTALILSEAVCRWRGRRPVVGAVTDDAVAVPEAGPALPRWVPALCLLVVSPFLMSMLLGAMLPSIDFDVKEYHLQGPKEYWQNGRVTFLSHNVYTSFPFLTEMLSLLAMVLRGDWFRGALAGKAVLMMFAPLTALGLFAVGRRWFSPAVGWLAAVIYLTTPWVYRISIIAYTEGGLAFYLLCTLLAVLWAFDGSPTRQAFGRRLLVSGFLAGSAVACKYPGLLSVTIPLGLVVVVGAVGRRSAGISEGWLAAVRTGLLFASGVLLAFGPWLLKNGAETGNPVYPLLYSVFGGSDWDESLNEKWRAAHSPPLFLLHDPSLVGQDLRERFLDVIARSDWQSPLLFAPALLSLFAAKRRRLVWGLWLYVAWLFLSWWGVTHRIDRFWVPMIPVVALLASIGLAWLLGDLATWRERREVFVRVAVLLLLATVTLFNLGFITTRLCGYNAYLVDLEAARSQVTTESIGLLQDLSLSADARMLFVGEAQVFDARFAHRYNTVFDHSLFEQYCSAGLPGVASADQPLRDASKIRQALRDQGITHVLVNWQEVLRYRTTYGYTDFVTPERFEKLVEAQVLRPVPVDAHRALRTLDSLSPSEQQEVREWGPQLLVDVDGVGGLVKYWVFAVR